MHRRQRAPLRRDSHMTTDFDTVAINHMTVAISKEMSRTPARRHADFNTLFLGGGHATERDLEALADFGLRKNWQVIYPVFDPANATAGPVNFHVVATDGMTEAFYGMNGRLWKRDRRCPAILVFADADLVVRLNGKGQLVAEPMKGRYHDHGYELASEAIAVRAARKPGKAPVVGPIGSLMTVQDIDLLVAAFDAAE